MANNSVDATPSSVATYTFAANNPANSTVRPAHAGFVRGNKTAHASVTHAVTTTT
jgi:hypothetical protein